MRSWINRFRRGNKGQAMVEYVVLIAVVSIVAVVSLGKVGEKVTVALSDPFPNEVVETDWEWRSTGMDGLDGGPQYLAYIGDSKEVHIPNTFEGKPVTSYEGMFEGTDVTKVTSDYNPHVDSMWLMFYGLQSDTLDVSGLNTKGIKYMQRTFMNTNLKTLDLRNWDVSSVIKMNQMIANEYGYETQLTSVNVDGWDVRNVTDMSFWLYNQGKLASLDLSSWDINRYAADYILAGVKTSDGKVLVKNDTVVDYITNPPDGTGDLYVTLVVD